ncbi:energy transducer TonB [Dyella silvae]|uniref:energy transducer TonB n=1 Tax=Dyella silvae TaxID=2994424 RepID=UPI0022640F42|nr:energy transducer TonB [Dyella silvae]
MFRKYVVAAWLLATCLSGHAWASADATDPAVVHAPIEYPASAVSAGEQGTVLVKAKVDINGRAIDATVHKSSGHSDLDEAALQSVSRWSFSPGMTDGKPQERWVLVPVTFQLKVASLGELASPQYLKAMASSLAGFLGALIWIVGFGWSVVLAKRKSILWLSGMVALWLITYPLFVATHWSVAKRNLILVALGIALMGVSLYFMPTQQPPI